METAIAMEINPMNRYGRQAQMHWRQWLPKRYAAVQDRETFFTDLGEKIELAIEDLSQQIAGPDPAEESSYLAKAARLKTARFEAEGTVLREMALLTPEEDEEEMEQEEQQEARARQAAEDE